MMRIWRQTWRTAEGEILLIGHILIKTIMAIVLCGICREIGSKEVAVPSHHLRIDGAAAEAEPQVPGSFATRLNYPTTRRVFFF